MQKDFLISLEKLEEIKELLPNIVYVELLKHTDKPELKAPVIEFVEKVDEEPVIEVIEEVSTQPTKQDYLDAIEGIEATLDVLSDEERQEAQDVIDSYRMIIEDMAD